MGRSDKRFHIRDGSVCQDYEGQWFVWSSPFSKVTQTWLVIDTNPTGDMTINDL